MQPRCGRSKPADFWMYYLRSWFLCLIHDALSSLRVETQIALLKALKEETKQYDHIEGLSCSKDIVLHTSMSFTENLW